MILSSASFWGNFCLRISRGNKSAGTTTGADGASSQGQLMGLKHDRHKGFKVGFLVDTMMPLSLTSNWIFSHVRRRVKRWSVIPSHHDSLRHLNLSKSNSRIRMKFPRSKEDKTHYIWWRSFSSSTPTIMLTLICAIFCSTCDWQ